MELFEQIDRMREQFIYIWTDVVNIESPTENKQGVDAVGNYFVEFAKNRGWQVEIFEQTVAGNCVCITMNADAVAQPISLCAHIDTVHPVGSFGTPAVHIDEKRIYGPGVMDCKGGAVAALMAMTALDEMGFRERPIQLLLNSDEETNSKTGNKETINYICRKALGSIAVLNCESIRENTAVLWRKGICRYRFDIRGTSIHASRCAEGASAIREAAYKIIELEKLKDPKTVTCNCGVINGGTSENTVPEHCFFTAEIRFNNNEEWDRADKQIRAIASTVYVEGTVCELTQTGSRPAMEKVSRNFELLEKLNGIYSKLGLPILSARQSLGGSDAAELTQTGIPCIDSIGVAGNYIHTTKEYAVLSSLSEAAKRIAVACESL